MKIAVFSGIFHPEPGGPATYLYELLPELQQRGHALRVVTYSDTPTVPHDYPYPVTRILRQTLPLRLARYALAARDLLAWGDLAYVHDPDVPLWGRRIPRVLKIVGDTAWERAVRKGWIPPTADIDAFQTQDMGVRAALQKAQRARSVRAADRVVVPSEYLKRMVVGWGVPPERVRVIYNALPPHTFAPDLTQAQARAELGLSADAPLLLTVARLTAWKGVDHLIAVLPSDVRLVIAGDGPELPALRAQAGAKAGAQVTFLGSVPRKTVALYMKAADYVALYSGYEGLSHVLLESLQAGTPVLASDKGGNPEVVRHEVNGLLVPYVDREALALALRTAFAPGKRAALAANHAQGIERFQFAAMLAQTAALLEGTGP